MTANALGRLQKIDARDIWRTEAQDFTPWLAQPQNLALLAEALNMELEIEAQEKNVGPFRADILCKDTLDSSWVLIENQLERADHSHLAQLLTYASGLHAVTIVWVSTSFTDEHRAALDWLNEITEEKFRFFGLEVELWRIGDSPAAPKFNVVSKPNEWSRSVGEAARRIETEALTDTKALQLQFWTELQSALNGHPTIKAQKPYPQHWTNFATGRLEFNLAAIINTREDRLGVELYIGYENAKAYFHLLRQDREAIEQELGFSPQWLELPQRTASRIIHYRSGVDPTDRSRWPEYHRWMITTLERFNAVFRERVRNLNMNNYKPGAADQE